MSVELLNKVANLNLKYPFNPKAPALTFVTAASKDYNDRLLYLISSLRHWEGPSARLIIYDLSAAGGASDLNSDLLCGAEVRRFQCVDAQTDCDLGTYAFKFYILEEVAKEAQRVVWLDSSLEFHRNLDYIRHALDEDGYWFATTCWPFPNRFTHSGTLQEMKVPLERLQRKNLFRPASLQGTNCVDNRLAPFSPNVDIAATFFAFDTRSAFVRRTLFGRAFPCAKSRNCIAPVGSNKENHRQDQTVLNVALYSDETERVRVHMEFVTVPDAFTHISAVLLRVLFFPSALHEAISQGQAPYRGQVISAQNAYFVKDKQKDHQIQSCSS